MSKEFFHFKGVYRGVFSKKWSQGGHGHQFSELKWEWIEISEVTSLAERSVEKEKVGDFIFIKELKPKGFFGNGIDLLIELPDGKTYSKKIFQVVLKEHAGQRQLDRPNVREMGSLQLGTHKGVANGEIYFSIPKPPTPKPLVASAQARNVAPITVLDDSTSISNSTIAIPNLVSGAGSSGLGKQAGGCLRKGCMEPLGSIGGLFKALRWLFIIGLLIGLLQMLGGWLKSSLQEDALKTKKGNVQLEDQRLDPKQDTMAPQPWNYLVDHKVNWSDFKSREFISTYTTGTLAYEDSKKQHIHWINSPNPGELTYWHDLYYDFNKHDQNKIVDLVNYFINEKQSKGLNIIETAELITTFIQEIPYYLIHEESCEKVTQLGGFISQYHAEKRPCLPYIIGGIQTPYEFLHNLKGDCDTRSLLGYTILKRMGINSSVWVSSEYGHSILGVAVPVNSPHYKNINGIRHFGVELTAKGYRIGMIAPEHSNMYNWSIALN